MDYNAKTQVRVIALFSFHLSQQLASLLQMYNLRSGYRLSCFTHNIFFPIATVFQRAMATVDLGFPAEMTMMIMKFYNVLLFCIS